MKKKKRILPAIFLSIFLAAGPVEAQGARFSNVYVFGDSLSNAGYFRPFLASLGLPAALVATMGVGTPTGQANLGAFSAGEITVGLAVSVYRVTGRSAIDEEGASAMLSFRF